MTAIEIWNRLYARIGIVTVLFAMTSFPIVSYFSYTIALGLPLEAASVNQFSRFSFFLLGSVAVALAVGRLFDFLLTAAFALFVEIFVITKGSIRARRHRGSERFIALYELYVIKRLDKFLDRGLSNTSQVPSLMFSALVYWSFFLNGDNSVWFVAFVILIFVIITNGINRRKRIPAYLNAKRDFIKRAVRIEGSVDGLRSLLSASQKRAEERRLRGDVDPVEDAEIESLVKDIANAEVLTMEIESDLRRLRFIAVNYSEIPRLLLNRLQPNFLNAIESPVGLIAIISAIGFYIGSARADLLLTSEPSQIRYGDTVQCGRVLASSDSGFFYRSEVDDKLILVSGDERIEVRFRAKAC